MIKGKGKDMKGDQKKPNQNKKPRPERNIQRDDNGCALGSEATGIIFQTVFLQKALYLKKKMFKRKKLLSYSWLFSLQIPP